MTVIVRLDRAIQRKALDCPVEPENDKQTKLCRHTNDRISKKAGIVKHATVYTLRHSFATHLLMSGVNIREIQDLLGHKNVEPTMIYTHVLCDMKNAPQSPLDVLYSDK
ncbi:MAG: tyrosine-type recombinase/integrase [Nitrospirota bacterium]